MTSAQTLAALYAGNIKHANYQPLPARLRPYLAGDDIESRLDPRWRDPRPRLPLLRHALHADPSGPLVVELGANTGYNTLTLAEELPGRRFVAVEASTPHAQFISEAAQLLGLANVEVVAEPMLPEQISRRWPGSDVLDFNVAHHFGVDIPAEGVSDEGTWWSHGLPRWLGSASGHPSYWFSVGFRWGGSRAHDLHDPDDPDGMVARLLDSTPSGMGLSQVWAAVGDGTGVRYEPAEVGSLTALAARESAAGSYRGEYFRRPILRFTATAP